MKRIIMLNTSPRGKKANSLTYLNALAGLFDLGEYQIDIYQMRSKEWDPIFAEMVQADYLVFATPLYLDSLSARTFRLSFTLREIFGRTANQAFLPGLYYHELWFT